MQNVLLQRNNLFFYIKQKAEVKTSAFLFSSSIRLRKPSSFLRCFVTKKESKEPPFLLLTPAVKRGVSIEKILREEIDTLFPELPVIGVIAAILKHQKPLLL